MDRGEFLEKWTGYAALFDYGDGLEQAPEARLEPRLAGRVLPALPGSSPSRRVLALVAAAVWRWSLPIFTQQIVDQVLIGRTTRTCSSWLLIAMVAVLVAMTVASIVQRYLLSRRPSRSTAPRSTS